MNPVLAATRTSVRAMAKGAGALAGVAFLALFVVNIAQIIMRTFAGGGWIWVTDLSQLLFVWMVMLGTVAAYHERDHIVVDFLISGLTGFREVASAVLIRTVEVALFLLLFRGGVDVTVNRGNINYVQLGVPTSWGYAAIPVAAALLLLIAAVLPLRYERAAAEDDIVASGPADTSDAPDAEEPR